MNDQVNQNKTAYEKIKSEMEAKHLGQVALMHDGEIVNFYNDFKDAYSIGVEKYGLGEFTLQEIGEQPIKLGFAGMYSQYAAILKAH